MQHIGNDIKHIFAGKVVVATVIDTSNVLLDVYKDIIVCYKSVLKCFNTAHKG